MATSYEQFCAALGEASNSRLVTDLVAALEASPHGWPRGSIRVGEMIPQNLSENVLQYLHFKVKDRECTIAVPMNKLRTEWHVDKVPTSEASRAAVRVMQMLEQRIGEFAAEQK